MNPSIQEYNQWRAKNPQENITVDQWQKLKSAASGAPEKDFVRRTVDALSGWSKDVSRNTYDSGVLPKNADGTYDDSSFYKARIQEEANATNRTSEFPSTGFAGAMDRFVGQPAAEYITPGARETTRSISEGMPKLATELGVTVLNPPLGIGLMAADAGTSSYSAAKDAGLSTLAAIGVGAIGGGIAALVPGASKVGAGMAAKQLATAGVENRLRQKAVEYGASQVAMGGLMEGGRMAQELATTGKVTPITDPEIAFQSVLGQIPFTALDIPSLMSKGPTGTQNARFEQVRGMYDKFMESSAPEGDAGQHVIARDAQFAKELTAQDKAMLAPHYVQDRANNNSEAQRTIRAEFEKAAGFDKPDFSLVKGAFNFGGPLPPNLALRAIIKGDVKPMSPSNIVGTDRQKYDVLQQQIKDMMSQAGTPEFNEVWKQSEEIKNRHGGMPPGETAGNEKPSTLGRGTSEQTVQLIRDLQRDYSGGGISNAQHRANLQNNIQLALAVREGTATPEQIQQWDALKSQVVGDVLNQTRSGNKQVTAAWVLDFLQGKKELEGFNRQTGFDENSWAAQSAPNPKDLALSINLAAHDLHESLNPQNPIEVGQMIRTVNTFSASVDAALREAGVEPAIIEGADVMRITPEKLQKSYHSAYTDYLYAPNEESASRTVEWVKNQLLVHAEIATKRLADARQQNDTNLSANWEGLLAKDKAFGPAIQSLPRTIQQFIGKQYGRFAQEENGRWALPGWIEKVTKTINSLTPEQRQKLAEVDTQMTGAATEAANAEKFKQTIDLKRANKRLESRNVGDTSADLPTAQKSLSEKALQDALSAIPIDQERSIRQKGKESEKVTVASNLYRLLTQGGIKETIYGNDAAKAGSKELRVDQNEESLQDTIDTIYDDLGNDAKVNESTGATNPVKAALVGKKAQVTNEGQSVETEAETQARELREAKDLEEGNVEKTTDVNIGKVASPEATPETGLPPKLAEHFTGTLENPIQRAQRMSDLELEVLFDQYGSGKLGKHMERLSATLGRPATKNDVLEWYREFLMADPVGTLAEKTTAQVLQADFSAGQKVFMEKYKAALPTVKTWRDARNTFFQRDPIKQALLRTEMLGLKPKPGTNLTEVFGLSQGGQKGLPKAKFIADARQTLATVFAEAGYQPSMVQALADLGVKMAEPFRWLTHANFAQLVDRKALVDQWDGRMFTLGTHIPSGSVVEGKLVKNPIVGLLVDQGSLRWQYPRMASFLTLATWPHELFHLATRELIDKPDPNLRMNADTLAQAVALKKMLNTSEQLTPQERYQAALEIADVTMPKNAAYDGKALKPEIAAYLQRIAGNSREFAAYVYQMHSIGLAARLMEVPDSQGMLQWNRVAKEMSDQMVYLPDEMQIFLRSQFRTLGLFAEGMQKTGPEMQQQFGDTQGNKVDRLTTGRQPATRGTMETIGALGKAAQEVTEAGTRAGDTSNETKINRIQQEIDANRHELNTRFGELSNGEKYRLEKRIRSGEATLAALKPSEVPPGPSSSLDESVIKQTGVTARAMYEIIKAVAKVNAKFEQASTVVKQLASNMEAGYVPDPTTTVKQIDVADLPNTSEMQNLPRSAEEAQTRFFDSLPKEQRQVFEQNWITRRLISPSFRMWDLSRRGVEEADRAYAALRSTPALTHKYISQIMTPISTRIGKLGEIGLDPAKAYVQFLEQAKNPTNSRMHDSFNKLIGKVQELKGLQEVNPQANSPLMPGQAAPASWKRGDPILQHPDMLQFGQQVMHFLPQDQQHLVATALDDYFATTKHMTDMELLQAGTTSKYLIGRRAMMMSKMTDSDQAVLVGQLALKATEVNPANINATIQADNQLRALTANGVINPKTLESVLAMGKVSNEGLAALQKNYDSMGHYAPESRAGDRLIWYTDANGERASIGADGKLDAIRKSQDLIKNHQASALSVQLKSDMKGSKSLLSDYEGLGKVESFISKNFDAQMNLLRSQGPEGIAAADDLQNSPHNPKLAFGVEQMTSALNDARMHRKLYPGREHLDYVRTLEEAVLHRGSAMARSDTRLTGDMTIQALEHQGYKDVAKDMRIQLSEALAPTSNLVAQLNTAAASYQMGGVSANLLTEATQGLTAGLPILRMEGVAYGKTWKTFINAVNTTLGWTAKSPFYSGGKFADLVHQYEQAPMKASKESTLAYHMQKFTDEGRLGVEQTVDVLKDAEVLALNQMQIGRKAQVNWRDKGTLLAGAEEIGKQGVAGLYAGSKLWLIPFKVMTEANQRAFAYSALDVGYEKGLRGDELQVYAAGLTDRLAMSGGGRANRLTGVTLLGADSPFARNLLGTATLLQSYGANMTWMMMNAAKDAMGGTKGISPTQRRAAQDSVLHMTAASLFIAGTLGVPGVGLALALFNKEDTARKAAKAMANLLPIDDATANTFTETAMNGVVNTATGLDVGGRAAVSSFMGLGSNKLDLNSIGGVMPSTIKDLASGSKELANGEYLRALQYGGPRNVRAAAGLLKSYVDYGDGRILDREGNQIMQPNVAQQIGMVAGVTPSQVRTRRQKVDAVKTVNQDFNERNGRELDKLAILMLNKEQIAQRSVVPAIVQLAARTGTHPKELISTIYDRAVNMQIPTDPTREGNIGTSTERTAINASFGQPVPTETARVQLKQYLEQSLGFPFDSQMPFQRQMENKKSLQKASAIDALMQQQQMTLQEARQYIEDTNPRSRD